MDLLQTDTFVFLVLNTAWKLCLGRRPPKELSHLLVAYIIEMSSSGEKN